MSFLQAEDLGLETIESYVFPGNRAFDIKNPSFSTFQDLTAELTYVAPQFTIHTPRLLSTAEKRRRKGFRIPVQVSMLSERRVNGPYGLLACAKGSAARTRGCGTIP
ncbi:hypothetical protein GQ53DRAFT_762080 [Thozetella sp. PMI_491]|nr:hypothetical protein GQ53DRAFT_762080 [Thozetella sp. PMI_491]